MKRTLLLVAAFACAATTVNAQLLKKLKDKVNKTINKDDDKTSSGAASGSDESAGKTAWCDTIQTTGTGADGISYTKVYSAEGKAGIVYTESSIGLRNDPAGNRLVLSEYVNGKTQFTVVENGKVVAAGPTVDPKYTGNSSGRVFSGDASDNGDEEMKKYLIPDSSTRTIPKTQAHSVTVSKVDENQMATALAMARQTDEYKNMSEQEKKEFEENIQKGLAAHNSMAGQTISVPATQGGSYSMITGYKLVVKGKNYGKFLSPPTVHVSADGASVFAVGLLEGSATPSLVTQAKKVPLDKRFSGGGGRMLRSASRSKVVYIEQQAPTAQELQAISTSGGAGYKQTFNVLHPDGSVTQVTDYSGMGRMILSETGAVISINESTGEVYADNKKLGQFMLSGTDHLESSSVLIGATMANIAYYNGSDGSLRYLDGSVKKLGILYPRVTTQNGKSYVSWFRKCRNDIYIGKFSY